MKKSIYVLGIWILLIGNGCNKFLDEKSDKKLAVPNSLIDLQALMDDVVYVGGQTASESEVSTDDYYVKDADLNSLPESEQALYKWAPELPDDDRNGQGWQNGYREVYYCNLVLERLLDLRDEDKNSAQGKDVMGQALLKRGVAMLAMAEIWTLGYSLENIESPYGLPIRQNTNFNERSKRATLGETYSFIEKDLLKSVSLLPIKSISKYRPTKAAAYGYLARLALFKNDYSKAIMYADSSLFFHNGKLLDFALLDATKRYPMPLPEENSEVIYVRGLTSAFILDQSVAKMSFKLLNIYDDNDYRLSLFFSFNSDSTKRFRGSYRGAASHFSGIAIDEMYLIKIEGLLRTGELELAKALTKEFVKHRYDLSTGNLYGYLDIMSKDQFINFILNERRKELVMRGIRWSDIKRLNKLGLNLNLERIESNITLPANDLRFAIPIPQKVIDKSQILKNER